MESLRHQAKNCIEATDLNAKINLSNACHEALNNNLLIIDPNEHIKCDDLKPGRPAKPILVSPDKVPKRGLATIEGRIALIHAIAHIEFNAINLAWDAVSRFSDMPEQYYRDWSKVAYEETLHFNLLREHLCSYGYEYGDFEAHDGLWQMAERTKGDVLIRMALIPRVLEARGLDVTPSMIKKFESIQDQKTADILNRIYTDEIGHVKIGSYWFNYLCQNRSLEPKAYFQGLIEQYFSDGLRGPFNFEARQAAGFSSAELKWLNTI